MRSNLIAGGMMACGVGCVVLTAVPGLAEIACAAGGGLAIGGLLLWKPKAKPTEASP